MTQLVPTETAAAPAPPTVTESIARLVPYSPGKPIEEVERELGITGIVKLASNENSLGPAPRAIEAVHRMAEKMHIYPDAYSFELRQKLAAFLDLPPSAFVFGNGSDDVIHLLGVTFLQPGDEIIQSHPSFVRYESAALLSDCVCHLVPANADWAHDLDAMADRINDRTRLIFICNPNNPTGTIVGKNPLDRFLDRVPARAIVVIDEAYFEYAAAAPAFPDTLPYVREGRNVAVLRTFSKAYGLAGHRIGYGMMRPEIADWLNRTREPFNVNYMAQAAAVAALDDTEHIARTIEMNETGKRDLYAAFDALGLPFAPTFANFVWVDVKRDAQQVFNAVMRKGVIVRASPSFDAPTHIRVTIGTPSENAKFLAALREVLAEG